MTTNANVRGRRHARAGVVLTSFSVLAAVLATSAVTTPAEALITAITTPYTASAAPPSTEPTVKQLVTGLQGASGSTVGPGRDLFVTEGLTGRILRVDRKTGEVTTFATGLPKRILGVGGVVDVAFIDTTAYALVTMVGPDVGGTNVVGIYRIDDADSFTVIADLGAFGLSHPPNTPFTIPTGVHFALEVYRGKFLVTDGNHNRVLRVTPDGKVSELVAFDNIVPTGLEDRGKIVYMAQAGPLPHLPEDGKVGVVPAEVAVSDGGGIRRAPTGGC